MRAGQDDPDPGELLKSYCADEMKLVKHIGGYGISGAVQQMSARRCSDAAAMFK
jgi:hypothetical protein